MSARSDELRAALVQRLTSGPGHTSPEARRAAFDDRPHDPRTDALLRRVAQHAWTVQDSDVAAPLSAGVRQDEVFELVVCAAVGQATRQLDTARAALAEAIRDPEEPI